MNEVDFDLELQQYLLGKLGQPPTPQGSRRRWWILCELAKYIKQHNPTSFDDIRFYTAKNLQCLQDRTLRENYLQYLHDLKVITFNMITGVITWRGE